VFGVALPKEKLTAWALRASLAGLVFQAASLAM